MKTFRDRRPETVPLRLVVTNADRSLSARREEWICHYSRKRIVHQWTQLALLGSLERFFGVLVEHYGGAFPVWLAPVQAVVLPIADGQVEYARSIVSTLHDAGFRVEADESNERLQKKIKMQQSVGAIFPQSDWAFPRRRDPQFSVPKIAR